MKKCKSCQKEIDDKARKCPYCQEKQGNWLQRHPIISSVIAIIVFIIIISSTNSSENKDITSKSNDDTVKVIISGTEKDENSDLYGDIAVGEINVWENAGPNRGKVIGVIAHDSTVQVLKIDDTDQKYYFIKTEDGLEGWVSELFISNEDEQNNELEKSEKTSETVSQKNAVKKAKSYVSFSGFSKSGLIKQLEFEKFSTEDASYAVNAIEIDWNEQASRKAKSYLDMSGYSRDGLIKQLEFEGFTKEQAIYAVNEMGL